MTDTTHTETGSSQSTVVRCRHTLDPAEWDATTETPCQIDSLDSDGVLEETTDGRLVWRCPHEATDRGVCVFHDPDGVAQEELTAEFVAVVRGERRALDGDGLRPPQFIDADLGSLDLTGTTVAVDGPIDLRHARFDSFEWRGATIRVPIDARAIEVAGRVDLTETTFEASVSLDRATFGGAVDCSSATFAADAGFANARFEERGSRTGHGKRAPTPISAQFSGAAFEADATFEDATVAGAAFFRDTSFAGRADFSGVRVGDWAHFHGARFRDEADFSNATFEMEVRFWDTNVFERRADFSGARFAASTGFTGTFERGADFSDAVFEQGPVFRCVFEGDGDFSGTTFEDHLELSFVDSDLSAVDFSRTRFPRSVDVNFPGSDVSSFDVSPLKRHLASATFDEADVSNADLSGCRLSGASFRRTVLRGVDFTNADVANADFTGADLTDATVHLARHVNRADFSRANFRGQDLRTARVTADETTIDRTRELVVEPSDSFRRTTFERADFSEADLHGTNFACGELSGAVFDGANCRFADFRNATLEDASFVETDLRSARFDGARIYRATFTDCDMDRSTTLSAVDLYDVADGTVAESGVVGRIARALRARGTVDHADDAPHDVGDEMPNCGDDRTEPDGTDGDGRAAVETPDDEGIARRDADRTRFEKQAWTHETIHRQLIRSGRYRRALTEKHYLREQDARIRRARLDGNWARIVELNAAKFVLLLGEVPLVLAAVVGLVALAFGGLYLAFGGLRDPATATVYTGVGLSALDVVRLFVYSLVTLLDGMYVVVKTPLDPLFPFELFEPTGAVLLEQLGVSTLEPVGAGVHVRAFERAVGAVLIVPFSWLAIKQLRIYFGSTTSEEGVESGFVSWFRGR
ncbi:pentapeptide repeat-containing protein [Salinigranum salinum]|uniref:pentapeptide repeat-containing protein n=1 Tax=Salinigranum salinum TaxID=1364937 RepID=UPI001260ECD9|nr:pentapeptide repeat-containing protein [Salinigranum salinum]